MVKKFTEHNGLNLTATNDEVLAEWNKKDIFHKSIDEREGCPQFVFFEGPPSANGHPGIHHVLARSIKDTFNRYKTMKGFQVHRKAGWDTHGLPVELGVEKELGITKADIDNKDSEKYISVRDYNNKCRENVMKFTAEWRSLTEKMGYFVDLDNPYITYDNKYIETLWWLLKQLYNKDLLYKGYTIQPYSPAAGTGLSSHELNQPGCYRDVKDTTVTAQFKIKNPRQEMTGWGEAYFLAWTTTPWTLAANSALCVGPKINYVAVRTYNPYTGEAETVVLAEERLSAYFSEAGRDADLESYSKGDKVIPWKVVGRYLGPELVGMEYEQLLPFISPLTGGAFRVISGDYVTTEDGTGIVHIAPNFGADDAFVAKKAGVPPIVVVDKKGQERPVVDLQGKYFLTEELDEKFVAEHVNVELWNEYAGRYVKNAYDETLTDKDETLDVSICMDLKASNKAFKIEKHVHNYPHCWRTDKPILYYPLDSWFIRSTAKKDRMVELNRTINWQPESTGTGRFGNWLENLNDWNLSRSRFWGTPLPIWRDEDGNEICIGSVHELYDEIEKSVAAGFMQSNTLKDLGFVPDDYSKEKWSADFPDRAGQEVRPTEAVENTLDYDVLFPQYLSEDPVVFNQQNKTVSQLVSNDARLYERISATAADINAHLTDANAHATGISGNAASASKLQTGRKIHRVVFDGTKDITLPDFSGCGEKTAGQSGMVPSPSAGKLNTVLHSNGSWGKVTYADMDEEAVAKIQACPFPVNAIYISADGKNPATYWPGTTWVAFAMPGLSLYIKASFLLLLSIPTADDNVLLTMPTSQLWRMLQRLLYLLLPVGLWLASFFFVISLLFLVLLSVSKCLAVSLPCRSRSMGHK